MIGWHQAYAHICVCYSIILTSCGKCNFTFKCENCFLLILQWVFVCGFGYILSWNSPQISQSLFLLLCPCVVVVVLFYNSFVLCSRMFSCYASILSWAGCCCCYYCYYCYCHHYPARLHYPHVYYWIFIQNMRAFTTLHVYTIKLVEQNTQTKNANGEQ